MIFYQCSLLCLKKKGGGVEREKEGKRRRKEGIEGSADINCGVLKGWCKDLANSGIFFLT